MAAEKVDPREAAAELLRRRRARTSYLDFLKYVWWMPHEIKIGRHTREICQALDDAVDAYFRGESTYLDIQVPFRHGKSDMVSRCFPAYFLARCYEHRKELEETGEQGGRDPDVIMSGYGAELVAGFSKRCKAIIQGAAFRRLFPQVQLAGGGGTIKSWGLEGSAGEVTATGIGGTIAGKGGDLIILDDHTKSLKEARSKPYRETTWSHFASSLFTRRAPVTIMIVVATPWHIDDVQGRIKKKQAKGDDPDWPEFHVLRFPARNAPELREEFGEFLFSDRFSDEWYRSQYAVNEKTARALLDCDPVPEGGNRFDVSRIHIHKSTAEFPAIRYVRAWDLASSAKERDKDDPDWTVGLLGGLVTRTWKVEGTTFQEHQLWIKDAAYIQAEAPERDKLIRDTIASDGDKVAQYIEAFGGYKDAYTSLKAAVKGATTIKKSRLPGDKSAKASALEPIFEAGNVHLLEGEWNETFIDQFRDFPDGDHDDFVDPAAIIHDACQRPQPAFV